MPNVIKNQYQNLWTEAKATYRQETGSKKPAEKRFLGFFGDLFRVSTGIGDACKEADKALENIKDKKTGLLTEKGLKKAEEAQANLEAVITTYLVRLDREFEAESAKIEAGLAREIRESRKSLTIAEKKQDAKAVKAAAKALAEAEKNELEHAAAMKAAKSKQSALGDLKAKLKRWPGQLSSHIDSFAREGAGAMSPDEIMKAAMLMALKDKPSLAITLSEEIANACIDVLKAKTAADQLRVFNSSLYGSSDHARMRRLQAALESLKAFYPPEQKNWQKVFDKYGNANAGAAEALEGKDVKKAVEAIAGVVADTKKFATALKKRVDRGI